MTRRNLAQAVVRVAIVFNTVFTWCAAHAQSPHPQGELVAAAASTTRFTCENPSESVQFGFASSDKPSLTVANHGQTFTYTFWIGQFTDIGPNMLHVRVDEILKHSTWSEGEEIVINKVSTRFDGALEKIPREKMKTDLALNVEDVTDLNCAYTDFKCPLRLELNGVPIQIVRSKIWAGYVRGNSRYGEPAEGYFPLPKGIFSEIDLPCAHIRFQFAETRFINSYDYNGLITITPNAPAATLTTNNQTPHNLKD